MVMCDSKQLPVFSHIGTKMVDSRKWFLIAHDNGKENIHQANTIIA